MAVMTVWYVDTRIFAKNIRIRQRYLLKYRVILSPKSVHLTSTVSHSMVRCAVKEAQRKNVEVIRSHTSSANALVSILEERAERCVG